MPPRRKPFRRIFLANLRRTLQPFQPSPPPLLRTTAGTTTTAAALPAAAAAVAGCGWRIGLSAAKPPSWWRSDDGTATTAAPCGVGLWRRNPSGVPRCAQPLDATAVAAAEPAVATTATTAAPWWCRACGICLLAWMGWNADIEGRGLGCYKRIGPVAYKLELLEELINVHNTFHVSNLKKCLSDESLGIPMKELRLDDKLNFVEEPVEIMD
ncbi:hypothetical protein Tco_1240585 [Tanacetum coccineum]